MKKRILVGLSGGVDSAVTAHLLLRAGHDVTAGFMVNYTTDDPHCTTKKDLTEAQKVAAHLGIKLHTFDFQDAYHERIVKYIVDSYAAGLTPNPDVMCNSRIKFDLFLQEALALGFDAIATGHYARCEYENGYYHLIRGKDANKDQSYFLARLSQNQLKHTLFPLGNITKPDVRKIAQEIALPNADRKDSQGICFIGKVPMGQFLAQYIPKKSGHIIDQTGKILGQHDGVWGYTIGQRKGIKIAHAEPLFVIGKDITTNTLIVGPNDSDELFSSSFTIFQREWSAEPQVLPFSGTCMIRYRQQAVNATLSGYEDNQTHHTVTLQEPVRAIASGQICVFYKDDRVIGSGIIA